MGKVTRIQKARKEHVCGKCHCKIEKGTPYLRGEVNFGPTFIRCTSCGLKAYEVTSSEYTPRVGRLVEDWQEDYGLGSDGLEEMMSELEEIRGMCEERLDNMPEGPREGEVGYLLQERIDACDSAYGDLDAIDVEGFQNYAASEFLTGYEDEESLEKYVEMVDTQSEGSEEVYDLILNDENVDDSLKDELREDFEAMFIEAVDSALGDLEY